MSYFILFLLLAGSLVPFTIGKWLFKKTGRALAFTVLVTLLSAWALLRPVCKPIPHWDETVGGRIEDRTDRNLYLKTFQKRDGQWQHCKTWISRQFFF